MELDTVRELFYLKNVDFTDIKAGTSRHSSVCEMKIGKSTIERGKRKRKREPREKRGGVRMTGGTFTG